MGGIVLENAPSTYTLRKLPIYVVVLVYISLSFIWIATSDVFVEAIFDRDAATQISIIKGFLFVLVTSGLMYTLLSRYQRHVESAYNERVGVLGLLQAISENSTDAIYAKDLSGRYSLCNNAAAIILGKEVSAIIGKTDEDLFPSAQALEMVNGDQALMALSRPLTVSEVLPTSAGARFFDTTKGPLINSRGELIGVFGISRDATERMAAVDSLRSAAVELAATLQAIPDLLFDLDQRAVYREVWARNSELLVQQREEVLGKSVHDVLPKDAAEAVVESINEANVTGSCYGKVIRLVLENGTRWFELSTTKKGIDGEGVAHFLMLSRDITTRKNAEAEVILHQEYLQLLLTYAPAALAMLDKLLRYLAVSDRWLRDYKLRREDVIGRQFHDVFPSVREKWNDAYRKGLAGEIAQAYEELITLADGSETWQRWEVHPWRGSDNAIGGIVVFSEDITEKKASDENIANYVKKIERTARGSLQIAANAVEKRDPYTSGHEKRVGLIAVDIGRKMGWSAEQCSQLEMIGLVHDIGKIGIPSDILTKPSGLSRAEFEIIKGHPQTGYEILADVDFPFPVAEIILQHHERLDGTGYPRGLKGDQIRPETRIITVADVLESMASHRPYRPARGIEEALLELKAHRGSWYDEAIVDAVVKMITEDGYSLPS